MLIDLITFFLGVSLLFYCLFAGADFGAGILETFRGQKQRKEQRKVLTHAISPVWEANHVWVILVVVILFVAFPKAYAQISVYLHIPLTIMLLGIILRGCAFTFRYYDVIKDESHYYYSVLYMSSSILTPLMLGTIAGSLFLGHFTPVADLNFAASYIWPWFNLFSFSVGIFACTLFTFLASVYLLGETQDVELKKIFRVRAKWATAAALASGLLVFIAAEVDGLHLIQMFTKDVVALGCMTLATFVFWPLWKCIFKDLPQWARLCAGTQVSLVLLGWFKLQYPILLHSRLSSTLPDLTIHNTIAPPATLTPLLWALLIGSALIFPSLIYLLKIFKQTPEK